MRTLLVLSEYFARRCLQLLRKMAQGIKLFKFHGIIPPTGCIFNAPENIRIGRDFSCGPNCQVYAQDKNSEVIIGNRVKLNSGVMINADNGGRIDIGNNVIIGPNVTMRASNHNSKDRQLPIIDQGHIAGAISIEDNVWIGAHAIILPNITIGTGAVIAAGSVVTKNVPEYSVVAGIPTQVIKHR